MPDEPTPGALDAHRDDGYRQVGRFMVVFSQLIVRMYNPKWPRTAVDGPNARIRPQVVANEFFANCKRKMRHDKAEKRAAKELRIRVDEAIERRRAVAHWSWEVGYWSRTGGAPGATAVAPFAVPFLEGSGMGWNSERSLEFDLDARCDELVALLHLVSQYGNVCYGAHGRQMAGEALRVRDVLVLDNGKPALGLLALAIPPSTSDL